MRRLSLPDFKTFYIAIVIKTAVLMERHTYQWNKTGNPDVDPRKKAQPNFDRCKSNSMEERLPFKQIVLEQFDTHP